MRQVPAAARFVLVLAIGIGCVAVDHNTRVLGTVRAMLSARVVVPIVAFAQLPSQLADATSDFVKSRDQLIGEKKGLVEQLLRLESELQRNTQLTSENRKLRRLLDLQATARADAQVAEVINTSSLPFVDRVQLDKGRGDGVRNGEGVFDREGVVGQVTRTDAHTSVITLLTDPRIWMSTRVGRNGLLAVVQGDPSGSRLLKVHYVPADADLQVGDLLRTTGDGKVFPPGLPVARIVDVRKKTGQAFLEATARPTGSVSQHRLLMVYKSTPVVAPNLASFEAPGGKEEGRSNPIRALLGGQ
jgi:rod shape-determining protein MreC